MDKLSESLVAERKIPEADESYFGKHQQAWEPDMPVKISPRKPRRSGRRRKKIDYHQMEHKYDKVF